MIFDLFLFVSALLLSVLTYLEIIGLKNGSNKKKPSVSVRNPGTISNIPANSEYISVVYCCCISRMLLILNRLNFMLLSFDFIKYIPMNMVRKIQRITFKLPIYEPISIKVISSNKGIKIRMYLEIFMK